MGNRNDLLRFRFRLWKSFGSGSVSAPDPDIISTVFQRPKKFVQNLLNYRRNIVSQTVGLSFFIFLTFVFHFMLDPDPNPVPEPKCITVPVPEPDWDPDPT